MFVQMSIHRPKQGKEELVKDSMHRFQDAIRGKPGFISVGTYKDRVSGHLVGIAFWKDYESMQAARPAMAESTKNDRFDEWEEGDTQALRLDEV